MASRVMREIFQNFEKYFCAFLMVVLVVCLGLQVFFRYVLEAALTWSEELSRFAFIWVIYVGASMAAKDRQHIRVTAQTHLLPRHWRPYQWLLADVVWGVFNILFAIQGIRLVKHMIRFPLISPSLEWSAYWIYAIIPVGFILMTFRIINGHYKAFRKGTWRDLYGEVGEGS
ncbi:MAG: TRAP transporter small permease [Deltaproteobacteria bacterium]|nr:TRAP transporter small permease [Deltaproteobacteria bacterium]